MAKSDIASLVRLNKFIAMHAQLGRRQADLLIEQHRVRVNGKPASLGMRVDTARDTVAVDGKVVQPSMGHFIYLLLNKPVGYVCSRRQQGSAPTIYTLLPTKYQHLKAVGRLDKDSSGLLLLTNDGNTAHHLMHPSFAKLKRYAVKLDQPLQPLHRQFISDHGVQLPDGPSKLELERRREGEDTEWLVTMREGRNRQIRRTFAALGYTVLGLHRIQFGRLQLAQLASGQYNEVSASAI